MFTHSKIEREKTFIYIYTFLTNARKGKGKVVAKKSCGNSGQWPILNEKKHSCTYTFYWLMRGKEQEK